MPLGRSALAPGAHAADGRVPPRRPTLLVASPVGGSAPRRTGDGPTRDTRRAFLGRSLPERRAGGEEGPWARRPGGIRSGTKAWDDAWSAAPRRGRAAPSAPFCRLIAPRKEEKVFSAGRKWLCSGGFKEGAGRAEGAGLCAWGSVNLGRARSGAEFSPGTEGAGAAKCLERLGKDASGGRGSVTRRAPLRPQPRSRMADSRHRVDGRGEPLGSVCVARACAVACGSPFGFPTLLRS